MSFDKNLAKKIQEESVLALEKIAKKYGVKISPHGGSLDTNNFIMKLKIEMLGTVKKYDTWVYQSLNLPEDIIGKKFTNKGINFTITEINVRSPKFPIIAEDITGKRYKFTVDSVKILLKLK